MDMSSMSMSMSGMGMGTGMFQEVNMGLAQAYWYLIAGVLGLCVAVRASSFLQRRTRSVRLHFLSRNLLTH